MVLCPYIVRGHTGFYGVVSIYIVKGHKGSMVCPYIVRGHTGFHVMFIYSQRSYRVPWYVHI